jgi:putative DNA primase/helicase
MNTQGLPKAPFYDAHIIQELLRSSWRNSLARLGVPEEILLAENTPCPFCGGTDRFSASWKEDREGFYCRKCGYYSAMNFYRKWKGIGFGECCRDFGEILGMTPGKGAASLVQSRGMQARRIELAKSLRATDSRVDALWRETVPLADSKVALKYFERRAIPLPQNPDAVRFHPRLVYEDGSDPTGRPRKFPALVSAIRNPKGELTAVLRTYLTSRGEKAAVLHPKKILGSGIKGGFIPLAVPDDYGKIGIAEGVETALSVTRLTQTPCIAVQSCWNLRHFTPPEGVKRVVFFADNDVSFAGQREAFNAAYDLKLRNPKLSVDVQLPPEKGRDWNDVLLDALARQAKRQKA